MIVDIQAAWMDLIAQFLPVAELAFTTVVPQEIEPILSQGITDSVKHAAGIHVGECNIGSLEVRVVRRGSVLAIGDPFVRRQVLYAVECVP